MGFKDKIVKGFLKGAKVITDDAPNLEMVIGGSLIAAGVITFIAFADDISEVNQKLRKTKEEIKDVDADEAGWTEMGESKIHYVARNTIDISTSYVKAAAIPLIFVGGGVALFGISRANVTAQLEATSASLASTAYAFQTYRNRVKEDQGEEKDFYYYTGVGVKKVVEVNPDGSTVETTVPVSAPADATYIPHSFIFDEHNSCWTKSPEENLNFAALCVRSINIVLDNSPYGICTENKMREIFQEAPTVAGAAAGAIREWEDGSIHHVRLNPVMMQRMINGEDPSAVFILEYDDGTPLHKDIYSHAKRLGMSLY